MFRASHIWRESPGWIENSVERAEGSFRGPHPPVREETTKREPLNLTAFLSPSNLSLSLARTCVTCVFCRPFVLRRMFESSRRWWRQPLCRFIFALGCLVLPCLAWYTIFTFEQQHSLVEILRIVAGQYPSNYQGFHSQWGQDRWVARYLSQFPAATRGIYIELGANDGLKHSNTAYFEEIESYEGLCIEPVKFNFDRLVVNRPGCINVYGAVFDACSGDTREFITFADPNSGFSGFADTFGLGVLDQHRNDPNVAPLTRQVVPCFSMAALLQEKGLADQQISYLALDTEGSELSVLKSMGFESFCVASAPCTRRPLVVQVEVRRHWQFGVLVREDYHREEMALRTYLQQQGYRLAREFSASWKPGIMDNIIKSVDLLFVRDA